MSRKFDSFARAVYEGAINGPTNARVLDAITDMPLLPQIEYLHTGYGDTLLPREVVRRVRSVSGVALGQVVDFQAPQSPLSFC